MLTDLINGRSTIHLKIKHHVQIYLGRLLCGIRSWVTENLKRLAVVLSFHVAEDVESVLITNQFSPLGKF